jgi:thiamine-phosphate pyrophosphorylase
LRRALDAGDVASLQLRLKGVDDDTIRAAVRTLKPIAQAKDVAFILNDRPDLAAELDCDGVHVGQDDVPYDEARKIVGPNKVVGITCHNSRHLALEAAEAGADYVAFGAFFPTATKEPKATAEIELVQWWAEIMEIPCVAIGGITTRNAAPLVEAGADFLAVSSGVWDHAQGPAAAVREFNALFAAKPR